MYLTRLATRTVTLILIVILLVQLTSIYTINAYYAKPHPSTIEKISITGIINGEKTIDLNNRRAVITLHATVEDGSLVIRDGGNVEIKGLITLINSQLIINTTKRVAMYLNILEKGSSSMKIINCNYVDIPLLVIKSSNTYGDNNTYFDNDGNIHVKRLFLVDTGVSRTPATLSIGSNVSSATIDNLYLYLNVKYGRWLLLPVITSAPLNIGQAYMNIRVDVLGKSIFIIPILYYKAAPLSKIGSIVFGQYIVRGPILQDILARVIEAINSGQVIIDKINMNNIILVSHGFIDFRYICAIDTELILNYINMGSLYLGNTRDEAFAGLLLSTNSTIYLGKIRVIREYGRTYNTYSFISSGVIFGRIGFINILNIHHPTMLLSTNFPGGTLYVNGRLSFTIKEPTILTLNHKIIHLRKGDKVKIIYNNAIVDTSTSYKLLLHSNIVDITIKTINTFTVIINGKAFKTTSIDVHSYTSYPLGSITIKESWSNKIITIKAIQDEITGFYNGTITS